MRCSLSDGPNCYQLESIDDDSYINNVISKLKLNNMDVNLENVSEEMNKNLKKFKDKHKNSINEVFKFTPKVMMNLLLNFESFDQTTAFRDVYMPEEKIINFNVGYLKLNFKGKLRLTQDKLQNAKINYESDGIQYPFKTYGIIEDRDLFLKFDKPVVVKYLFMRLHKEPENNKFQEISITGYLNENVEYTYKTNATFKKQWTRINLTNKIIDTIRLPKETEVDDIMIMHDSEYSGNDEHHQEQLTNILQTVIDDLIEDSNKGKRIKEEDI